MGPRGDGGIDGGTKKEAETGGMGGGPKEEAGPRGDGWGAGGGSRDRGQWVVGWGRQRGPEHQNTSSPRVPFSPRLPREGDMGDRPGCCGQRGLLKGAWAVTRKLTVAVVAGRVGAAIVPPPSTVTSRPCIYISVSQSTDDNLF